MNEKNIEPDNQPATELESVAELFTPATGDAPADFERVGETADEENEESEQAPPAEKPVETQATPSETPTVTPGEGTPTVTPADLFSGNLPNSIQPPQPTPENPADKKRGRGRPPGSPNKSSTASNIIIPDGATAGEGGEEKAALDSKQLAGLTFDLTTNSLAILLGPEWACRSPKERDAMIVAIEAYLRTKEMKDIPPGAILCFAIATYAAPRLKEPSTSGKIKWGWLWLKNWWRERKERKSNPFKKN